jgi:hypothetical protein
MANPVGVPLAALLAPRRAGQSISRTSPPCWMRRLGVVIALAVVGSCGGTAVIDPEGDSQTGGGGTTSTGTSTGTGTGTGGQSSLGMRVHDVTVTIDCMPVVGPDPVYVSFQADYDNTSGTAPGQATLINAQVQLGSGALMLVWIFDVTPTASGLVPGGQLASVFHEKVANSGSGGSTASPCEFCSTAGATLLLDVDLDGTLVGFEQAADSFGCAL